MYVWYYIRGMAIIKESFSIRTRMNDIFYLHHELKIFK